MFFSKLKVIILIQLWCCYQSSASYSQGTDDDLFLEQGTDSDGSSPEGVAVEGANSGSLKSRSGIADAEAVAGYLFRFQVPNDAFEGAVSRYEAQERPSWLSFNSEHGVFEGIPTETSSGGSAYVTLTAVAQDGTRATDHFSVDVKKREGSFKRKSKCGTNDVTMLTITLLIPTTFSASERVKLVKNVATEVGVRIDMISLIETPSDYDDPLEESEHLFGGVVSRRKHQMNHEKTTSMQLQWPVGCKGSLTKRGRTEKNIVESLVSSGKLFNKLNLVVVNWHVTVVEPLRMRRRRDLPEYSGDGYDTGDDEYYDYDYNYDDNPIFDLAKDKSKIKETTGVNTLGGGTPVVTSSITPTVDRPFVPSYQPPIMSTPVLHPMKPTRIIDTYPSAQRPTPSRVDPDSETSLLVRPTSLTDFSTPVVRPTATYSSPMTPVIDPSQSSGIVETTVSSAMNFPPRVLNRIKKLAWEVGNVCRYRIPADTFKDDEDGYTRNLTLVLKDVKGRMFDRDSWIQFDPAKQEIYALPLEIHVSRYDFILEAIDKERKSGSEFVTIRVIQPQQARNFHHQFSAMVRLNKIVESDFAYALDWQVKAVQKIAKLYEDNDLLSINIRNISTDPVEISWTNVSLVDSTSTVCPTEQLEHIAGILIQNSNEGDPTRDAKRTFLPEFQLKRVKALYFQPCEALNQHQQSRGPTHHGGHHRGGQHHGHSDMTEAEEKMNENLSPIIRNHINSITAKAGSLYRYQVPLDTCYDREDGDSRNLNLRLLTESRNELPRDSWLQFDEANQEFFGLPLSKDIGKKSYILDCIDRDDKSVSNALFAHVTHQYEDYEEHEPVPAVKFSLTASGDFDQFNMKTYGKAKLVESIANAFGDSDTDSVVIHSLKSGSIKVDWTNKSLPIEPCPKDEILKLRQIILDDNGVLKKSFVDSFKPDFIVVDGKVTPSGSCLSGDTPTHPEPPFVEGAAGTSADASEPTEDYWLTFIVPAVIIAVMLLLAGIIACCLYRRRRYGKLNLSDDRTFVSKGIPIIFAEELDDQGNDNIKVPTVLRQEKPPLPPPDYQRGKDGRLGRSATPPSMRGSRDMGGKDMNGGGDQPYHPPPPFTNGSSRNSRPTMPPAYRKPPNYCPP